VRSEMIGVMLARKRTSDVFFSNSELCGQRSSGRRGCSHLDEGEAPARIAFRSAAHAIRHSSVHRGIRLARIGWDSLEGFVWLGLDGILSPVVTHDMGAAFMLYAQGLLPFLLPLSVLLFEPDVKNRRRMLPFLVLGGATALYILWALTAYPLQVYVRGNSIVYINQQLFRNPIKSRVPLLSTLTARILPPTADCFRWPPCWRSWSSRSWWRGC
jgi:hypothetical protein